MAASLPQSDPPARQRERRRQLDVARGMYQFEEKRGFPPSVRTLPAAEEFTGAKRRRIDWYGLAALVDLRLAAFRRLFRAHRGLAAYDDFYPLLSEPSVSRRFKEFGTLVLVSGTTAAALDGAFPLAPVGEVVVRGKTAPVQLFKPAG
jgi:hypothetical protein